MSNLYDDEPERRWWRRRAVIAAVAVLAAVLLVAGGALLGRGTGTTAAPARVPPAPGPVPSSSAAASTTAQGSSSPTSSSAPAASPSEACPVGLVSDVLPASAPADVVWRATSVAPVPVSKTWGPYRTTATGLPRCFSHSPVGAVIAAASINTWLFSTQWRIVLATQVARNPGYTALQAGLESQPPDGSAGTDTVVGFNIAEYTPTGATVDLVIKGANGGVDACPLAVQWSASDWQLAPRPDGTLTEDSCPAAATGTYIPWKPGQ